jgi:carbohydrate diacid regulator
MVIESLERVAESVTQRTAELLSAPVSLLDERGIVIASTEPGSVGVHFEASSLTRHHNQLRVPIRLDGQDGAVVVSAPPEGESISPRLAQALVDLVIDQTAVLARLPNQRELKDKFIHDLLHGTTADASDILREGQILGMDFTRPRAVILIDAADYILAREAALRAWDGARSAASQSGRMRASDALARRVQRVIGSVVRFFNLPDATICAYIGNGEVSVLKASTTQDLGPWTDCTEEDEPASPSWANLAALKRASGGLVSWLRRDLGADTNLGIGRYHPGVRGLARSYRDARAALTLGRRFRGENQVHCLDALGIAAFVGVSDERTKVDLATHLLSPLDQEHELLQTLRVFFEENCCPSLTAGRLSIHRNTLSYRLDKISSLTGLDPRRFDDAVQIRLSLVLRDLRDAPSERER